MNNILKLREFLSTNTDKYRIVYSNKKEVKYLKLFDGNSFYNIQTENFKVYLKREDMSYSIESNDIEYIMNCTMEWLSNLTISDEIIWHDRSDYSFQERDSFLKNKKIYENFNFQTYHEWLERLSAKVDDKQSFLYYSEVEKVRLLTNEIEREQYLVKSQMLCYDTNINEFIINENNIFINDSISKNNNSNEEVKVINEILDNVRIERMSINPQTLHNIIYVVLENFKGEKIISLDSFLTKNLLNTLWLDPNITIWADSPLSFDKEGLLKKKIPIIEKGIIKNFINTSYAMRVLGSNSCGFSEFNSEFYGESHEIKYQVEAPFNNLDYHCSIVKAESPSVLMNDNIINIYMNIQVLYELKLYEGTVTFDFKEFMKHLNKNEQDFLIAKKVIVAT